MKDSYGVALALAFALISFPVELVSGPLPAVSASAGSVVSEVAPRGFGLVKVENECAVFKAIHPSPSGLFSPPVCVMM